MSSVSCLNLIRRSRGPARSEVLHVLGIVLFVVFGWSIRGFLYKLPSFTLYFGLTANLAILCYQLAFALVESLLITGLLLLASRLLPGSWYRDGFVYKSFMVVLVATIAMILFELYYREAFLKDILAGYTYPYPPFIAGVIGSLAALATLLWVARSRPRIQQIVLGFVDRVSLFTYIYLPLGLIGLVVVLVRNL